MLALCVCVCVCVRARAPVSVLVPFRRWEKDSRQETDIVLPIIFFYREAVNSLQTKHNHIHVGILNKNREGRPRGKNALKISLGISGLRPGILQVFWLRYRSSNIKGRSRCCSVLKRRLSVGLCIPHQPVVNQCQVHYQPLGFTGPVHSFLFLRLCLNVHSVAFSFNSCTSCYGNSTEPNWGKGGYLLCLLHWAWVSKSPSKHHSRFIIPLASRVLP